jgi:hypothetical protein
MSNDNEYPQGSDEHRRKYEAGIIDTSSGDAPKHMGSPAPDMETTPGTNMHKNYWVLSDAERAKGFQRPVRRTYLHLTCRSKTTMGLKIAETYAVNPTFYGSTFCVNCNGHFRVGEAGEFVWVDEVGRVTEEKVGT